MTTRSIGAGIAILFLLQACGHVEKKAAAPEATVENPIAPERPPSEPKEEKAAPDLPAPEIVGFEDGTLKWTWASEERVTFHVFISPKDDRSTFELSESVGITGERQLKIRLRAHGDRPIYLYVVAVDESGRQFVSEPFLVKTPPVEKRVPEPHKPTARTTPEPVKKLAEKTASRGTTCSPVIYFDREFRSLAPDGVDDYRERNQVEEGIFRLACPLMFDGLTEADGVPIPELQTEIAGKYRSYGLDTNHVTRLMNEMSGHFEALSKGAAPQREDPCWKNFGITDATLVKGQSLYSRMAEKGVKRFIVVYPAVFYGAEQSSYACAGIWKKACAGTTVEYAKGDPRYEKLTTCHVLEDGAGQAAVLRWKGRD